MNIFKLEYDWYEGEHEETLLGKETTEQEFEIDLIKARKFAESLIGNKVKRGDYYGRGYRIECLPEYYEQIVWFLIKKLKYIKCYFRNNISYDVSDEENKKITIDKVEAKRERRELK